MEIAMSDTADRLKNIVGEKNLVEKPDFSSSSVGFKTDGRRLNPDYLVKPTNSDQVQAIVQLANERSLPLIPVSSSGPHTTGGVKPQMPGTIIVDLSGMKKILKINRRHLLALIEPGVTWEELSAELKKHNLRIPHPLLPKKGKSVIASLVDREPLLSPKYQWNMTEPLRSLEIIFGSGDRIYSGMGGHRGEDDKAWEDGTIPATNAGPHQFDFMKMVTASQGTMGIVTWASVKVEPLESEAKTIFVEGKSFAALSDFLYETVKYRFGDEICILNRKALASALAEKTEQIPGIENRLAPWTALVNIKWGSLRAKEKVASQHADIIDIAQQAGLVPVNTVGGMPSAKAARRLESLTGENTWKTKTADTAKELFFLSTMDRIPHQLKAAAAAADAGSYPFADCPIYLQPLHQGVAVHCHIVLPMTADQAGSAEYKELYNTMSRNLESAGAFYSRPYDIWADIMYEGNTEHTNLTRKMKDIFDPQHILNPGKLCFQA